MQEEAHEIIIHHQLILQQFNQVILDANEKHYKTIKIGQNNSIVN